MHASGMVQILARLSIILSDGWSALVFRCFWLLSSFSQHPESIHQFMFLFGDRGTPDGFRRMHGFSSHTYKFVNSAGQSFWAKLHYRTRAGEKNLSAAEAARLEGADPDYATRDLFEHIAAGKTAEWDVEAQFIPVADGEKYKFNIFDLTKTVSQKDYPRVRIGKMVLNRNPQNYFAEVEQVGHGVKEGSGGRG